jgi:hypothetical protein
MAKITLFIILIYSQILFSQIERLKKPSLFFPQEKTQVLVVGSFHFDYPNLDEYKTADSNKIDVLIEPKKTEITELVEYIKKFKPTKIAIEAYPNWNATNKLREYNKGGLRNERSEIIQLAIRIASETKIDTLYSIDCESLIDDLVNSVDSNYFKKLFQDFDSKNEDKLSQMYLDLHKYEDELIKKINLLDYFKYINSEEYHKLGYGLYTVGDFKLSDSRGADILSIWWYNRNLRIFRKLQEINASEKDKLLIIFGNGHASVLRQLIESSPEFEFVEFNSLNNR